MTRKEEMESLRMAFRNLTIALLTQPLKGRPDVAARFYRLPETKQEEIEKEIERRAALIAETMCRKIAEKDLLEKDPSSKTVLRLYRDTLKEFEEL